MNELWAALEEALARVKEKEEALEKVQQRVRHGRRVRMTRWSIDQMIDLRRKEKRDE